MISDLARMPELRKAFVLGEPGLGASLLGINRRKAVLWPTTSELADGIRTTLERIRAAVERC